MQQVVSVQRETSSIGMNLYQMLRMSRMSHSPSFGCPPAGTASVSKVEACIFEHTCETERRWCAHFVSMINQTMLFLETNFPPPQHHKRQRRKYADIYKCKRTTWLLPSMTSSGCYQNASVTLNVDVCSPRRSEQAQLLFIIKPGSYTAATRSCKELYTCKQSVILRSVACIWL